MFPDELKDYLQPLGWVIVWQPAFSRSLPQNRQQGGEWISTAPSRWTAPPICRLPWPPRPSWSWPPQQKPAETPPSPARHPGLSGSRSLWKRTSTSPFLHPPTPSPPCTSVRLPCRAPSRPGTSQRLCSTCTLSSPLQTWTALPWACSTTAGWGLSGLSPPHKRRGNLGATSRPSPPPRGWRAASRKWRGRSLTLGPWKLGRRQGGSCSPCPACCLTARLHPARRSTKSTVSRHTQLRGRKTSDTCFCLCNSDTDTQLMSLPLRIELVMILTIMLPMTWHEHILHSCIRENIV